MDAEVLTEIKVKLFKIGTMIESIITELDNVETFESIKTGKMITTDFDDTDLTNIQMSIDLIVSQLQNLSINIDL